MKNNILFALFLHTFIFSYYAHAQQKKSYDLNGLFKQGKLLALPANNLSPINDGSGQGVALTGIVWLKGVDFKTGTIDVDLRGRDVFQNSFLGIAFHGVDTTTYDAIYFRPFNFQSPDTLRRKHTVQYISEPNFSWDKLRAEHPLVYEGAVNPFPLATAWFHAHIVVKESEIAVYVNNSAIPSLTVKKLNNRQSGLIGLWNNGVPGDFANLVIGQ